MKLLEISNEESSHFDELFEDKSHVSLEQLSPEVIKTKNDVKFEGKSISEFDGVYAEIPEKNAVFGRVLLEMIEEKGLKTNVSSTGFFIMAKKNYLHHVLNEKEIETPKSAVIASEKSVRNIGQHLETPMIGRKFENRKETEINLLEDQEEVEEFVEGTEYGEDVIVLSEYNEGEKYRFLVTGDNIISLKDKSDGWKITKDNLQYSNVGNGLEELVLTTKRSIGTSVAEILVNSGKVVDVNPNPDLEMYTEISGKNAFEQVKKAMVDQ